MAPEFKGKTRVQQHKMVYDALEGRMGGVLHALALTTAAAQRLTSPAPSTTSLMTISWRRHPPPERRKGSGTMSEQAVHDWIRKQVAANDVVLFMKGTKAMPQCGFSGQLVQILQYLGVDYKDVNVLEDMGIPRRRQELHTVADHPAALRQGRVRRRLRHRARDVPAGRAAGSAGRQGRQAHAVQGNGLTRKQASLSTMRFAAAAPLDCRGRRLMSWAVPQGAGGR